MPAPARPSLVDRGICADCLQEVRDPRNRRHGYPFTSCGACGPGFAARLGLPFLTTTEPTLPSCPLCLEEHLDPGGRRYGAAGSTCPACGPELTFQSGDGQTFSGNERAILLGRATLLAGDVLAVLGAGGFELWVDATDEEATGRLAARLGRRMDPPPGAPVHLMGSPVGLDLDEPSRLLLTGPIRPAVPVGGPEGEREVALPSTSLEALLLPQGGRLETWWTGLALDLPDATVRLRGLADAVLTADRGPGQAVDRSKLRPTLVGPIVLRSGRGLAPTHVRLAADGPTVLALGSARVAAPAFAHGRDAWVVHELGSLSKEDDRQRFQRVVETLLEQHRPELIATPPLDADPTWRRTLYEWGIPHVAVVPAQAAALAVATEHALEGPILAFVWDGLACETWACEGNEGFRVGGLPAWRGLESADLPLLVQAMLEQVDRSRGHRHVVATGEVFRSRPLVELSTEAFARRGIPLHRAQRLGPGEGGWALGQIAVARLTVT